MIKVEKGKIESTIETTSEVNDVVKTAMTEGKKIAKKDFKKFSTIVAVAFSIGLWVVKSIWYAYMSGKFSVYKIDRCYINADNENIFLQTIQLAALFIVWIFINYAYYTISVAEDTSKIHWKRKIKILIFWIIEMVVAFVFVLLETHNQLLEVLGGITVIDIVALIIAFFILCLMVNVFAIEFLIKKRWKERKRNKINTSKKNIESQSEQGIKELFLTLIVTVAVELIFIFLMASHTEYRRTNYKVIIVQNKETTEDTFSFYCGDEQKRYEIYPIAYENEDYYIITRMYSNNGKTKIDYDYQKVIEKEGQETIYVDDIYKIGIEN